MNKREDKTFVMERLDRAFASVGWIHSYPQYALHNQPILRSDHGAILLDFEIYHPFKRRPFRFEKMWTTHEGCKSVVQEAWKNKGLDLSNYGTRSSILRNYSLNGIGRCLEKLKRKLKTNNERY